jgi:hypothetical protein
MVCYYHTDRQAVGICKYCQRGLCIECAVVVDDVLACKNRHENQVEEMNIMTKRSILQARRVGSGYIRNTIFYFLVGILFSGFGLIQYRYLGLQAIFFILIGLFLLYAATANFIESKKYK